MQPTAYYIQIPWNWIFLIISLYKNSGYYIQPHLIPHVGKLYLPWKMAYYKCRHATIWSNRPSIAEMGKYLRRLVLVLDGTIFEKMDMLNTLKAEVDDHLRKTLPPKQTTLRSFLSAK